MTAAVVSLDALREQRRRQGDDRRECDAAGVASPIGGEAVRPRAESRVGRIVARFTTAGELCDGHTHARVAVQLGDEVLRGRVFLTHRDRFGQVRLVVEHADASGPRATAVILRPEARLLVLAPATRATRSAGPPCATAPRGPR